MNVQIIVVWIGKNLDVLSGTYSIDEKYTFAPGYCREQRRKKTFLSRGNIHYILILVQFYINLLSDIICD